MSPRTVSRILFGKHDVGKRVWYRASVCALVSILVMPVVDLVVVGIPPPVSWILAWVLPLIPAVWVYDRITALKLRNVVFTRRVPWWLRGAITIGVFVGVWTVWWRFLLPPEMLPYPEYFSEALIQVFILFLPPMFLAVRVYHHLTFVDRFTQPLEGGPETGEPLLPRDEESVGGEACSVTNNQGSTP
jgi:hypothetical protein